jgi:hypothetical protein
MEIPSVFNRKLSAILWIHLCVHGDSVVDKSLFLFKGSISRPENKPIAV